MLGRDTIKIAVSEWKMELNNWNHSVLLYVNWVKILRLFV